MIDAPSRTQINKARQLIEAKLSGEKRVDAHEWLNNFRHRASDVERLIGRLELLPDREKPFSQEWTAARHLTRAVARGRAMARLRNEHRDEHRAILQQAVESGYTDNGRYGRALTELTHRYPARFAVLLAEEQARS